MEGLKMDLSYLNKGEGESNTVENCIYDTINKYLKIILRVGDLGVFFGGIHKDDILKCTHLLTKLHLTGYSTCLGILASEPDLKYTETRLHDSREDRVMTAEFGYYIAAISEKMLYEQPLHIQVAVYNLDRIICSLVEKRDSREVTEMLKRSSEDKVKLKKEIEDKPSLTILKNHHIAFSSHMAELNRHLAPYVAGDINPIHTHKIGAKRFEQCIKMATILVNHIIGDIDLIGEEIFPYIDAVKFALCSDAFRKVKIETRKSINGKSDTSLWRSIDLLIVNNLIQKENEDDYTILTPTNFSGVPEVHSAYLYNRAKHALNTYVGGCDEFIHNLSFNPATKDIHDYLYENKMERIVADLGKYNLFPY
jgi:hypothetical protein